MGRDDALVDITFAAGSSIHIPTQDTYGTSTRRGPARAGRALRGELSRPSGTRGPRGLLPLLHALRPGGVPLPRRGGVLPAVPVADRPRGV